MTNRSLRILFVLATAAVGLALTGLAAYAGTEPGPVKRGQACSNIGEHRFNRSGVEYVCEQRPSDKCPVFHAAHPVHGNWPSPSPCMCPSKMPSRSASAAASPSESPIPPAVSNAPVPVAEILPVTGTPDVFGLVGAGFVAVGAGLLLLVGADTVRRRNH